MKNLLTRTSVKLAIAAALLITTGACAAPDPQLSETPTEFVSFEGLEADAQMMSHRWIAPNDVELDSPELRAVRSYIESENIYEHTGDPANVHPGYWDVRPHWNPIPTPQYGTIDHYVLLVEPVIHMDEPVTEIFVCSDYMKTGILMRAGWTRVEVKRFWSFRLRPSGENYPAAPSLDYENMLPYPTWNVFDGVHFEDFTDTRTGENDPGTICQRDMPGFDSDTPRDENLPAAPAVEPFNPGWPALVDDSE